MALSSSSDRQQLSETTSMQELQEAFASLQLPRMPPTSSQESSTASSSTASSSPALPSIRILVVADIDLPSASALSEYSLQQKVFDASMIDLIIACGSFCRDSDLRPYLRGQQQRQQRQRGRQPQPTTTTTSPSTNFFRTKEQTASLEGLMTAALSQLESIVCRVIYCPGSSDPITTLIADRHSRQRRLTPNSLNVHRQWLPLAPGIGCAALFYFDSLDNLLMDAQENGTFGGSTLPTTARDASADASNPSRSNGNTNDGDDDSSTEETNLQDAPFTLAEQLLKLQANSKGYCATLEQLLKLAPAAETMANVPFLGDGAAQSLLVTHYEDWMDNTSNIDADYLPVNGSPLWALEKEDKPWPVEHNTFMNSATVNKRLLLEIASGSPGKHKPQLLRRGKKQILLPGSLRERGEFCILQVNLQEEQQSSADGTNTTWSSGGVQQRQQQHARSRVPTTFAWNVERVDFHNLNSRSRH